MGGVVRPIAVALGSNLGDRRAHLDYAIARLRTFLRALRVSSFHETTPVGVASQPLFLNGAAVGLSAEPAFRLLERLLEIERERGRERPFPGAPRTLDLDLILCGDETVSRPGLDVPHPRFRERAFVLAPLAEIAPELVDPVTGTSMASLYARVMRG
jgi:2-amino-4-hydroxy-6-hydroxymethyldihydropteridine diphosphokinase